MDRERLKMDKPLRRDERCLKFRALLCGAKWRCKMAEPDVSAISAPTDQRRPLRYSREMKHILTAENARLDAECFVVRIPYSLKNSFSLDGPRVMRGALDRPILNGPYFGRKIR